MSFVELTSDNAAEVIAFYRRHGDPLTAKLSALPNAKSRLFKGRRIYGRRRAGKLSVVISVAERTHLTWDGWIYFPFVVAPRLTPEKKRRLLVDFLKMWRALPSSHWRRMIIYDDTPEGDEAAFLTSEGFTFVRRHMKHVRDLTEGPPPAEDFPRVAEALARGYSVSTVTTDELKADPAFADRIVAMRNRIFATRDNTDRWTPAEMMRQMSLPGATMLVLWHEGNPAGLALWFLIDEGEDKDEAYGSEIAILRRHWGKTAADLMGIEIMRAAHAQGARTMAAIADESNRASRDFLERLGLQVRKVSVSWALEIAPVPPR